MNWPLYCARLAVSHYRLAGAMIPDGLVEHLESLTGGSRSGTNCVVVQQQSSYDVIGADQAAAILGCSSRYVRRIHTDLDGHQIAGRWAFNRHTVLDYAAAKGAQHE